MQPETKEEAEGGGSPAEGSMKPLSGSAQCEMVGRESSVENKGRVNGKGKEFFPGAGAMKQMRSEGRKLAICCRRASVKKWKM